MKSLNTAPALRERNKKIYQFNLFINHNNQKSGRKWRRHPLNMNLKGFECWFKFWLLSKHKIKDHDLYFQNIESNFDIKNLYLERSTGKYLIVNR